MRAVEDTPITPSQQTVLLVLEHGMGQLTRSTHAQLHFVNTAATHRLAIKGLVDVDFQNDTAVLTEAGRKIVAQMHAWRNARPIDVQKLLACKAHEGGPTCGCCHVCGGKLRTMLSPSCQRCGSSDADE